MDQECGSTLPKGLSFLFCVHNGDLHSSISLTRHSLQNEDSHLHAKDVSCFNVYLSAAWEWEIGDIDISLSPLPVLGGRGHWLSKEETGPESQIYVTPSYLAKCHIVL